MSLVQVGFMQLSLIEMSLTAGILIIGIVLFRSLFVHRIPKRIMLILWGLVVLRLLIPFCLSLPVPGIGAFMPGYVQPAEYFFDEITVSATALGTENTGMTLYTVDMSPQINWGMILKILYLAGTTVMITGSAWLYIRDGKLLKESLPMQQEEKKRLIKLTGAGQKDMERLAKIDFRISDRTATPVTYGIFHPAIVFPKGIFLKEEKEVGFCLLHELVHIRNYDNLKKVIVHVALCIHWFNPLVWVMYSLFNRDIELLCDETAVQRCTAKRQDYAIALLSLAERRNAGFRTALGFGKNAVKERILAVMTVGKTSVRSKMAAGAAVILALSGFLGSRVSASELRYAEYTITASEDVAAAYEERDGEYATVLVQDEEPYVAVKFADEAFADTTDTTSEVLESAETYADRVEMDDVVQAVEMTAVNTVMEEEGLPASLLVSLQSLAEEFGAYGLQVEITSDDYQLYYDGKPVYFFADNRSRDKDSFSGTVYAREAGNGNGNTGVATKRDESGVIVGLVSLSEEESKDMAMAWTGKK